MANESMKNFYISNPPQGVNVEELEALGGQILNDQAEWLDKVMKEHLPEHEYDKITKQSLGDEEVSRILNKYGLKVENVFAVMGLRLWKFGRCVAEFKPQFQTEDGQKVYPMPPSKTEPDPYGDSLWPGKN